MPTIVNTDEGKGSMGAGAIWASYDLFGADRLRGVVTLDQTLADSVQRLVEALGRVPRMSDARAPETWPLSPDHAEQDWRDVVARVAVPSLFIAGRDSRLWPCEHATAAAATNSAAAALLLDDCGHAADIDRPDLVNDALPTFLAGLA